MSDGRVYTVEFINQAETLAVDFFELTAADDKKIGIIGGVITQNNLEKDANEDNLALQIIRGHTTSGSGGGTATPRPVDPDDSAAGFTCEHTNTTIASAGSAVNLHSEAFINRQGFLIAPKPKEIIKTTQGAGLLVVRLITAPAVSTSWTGTLYVVEF